MSKPQVAILIILSSIVARAMLALCGSIRLLLLREPGDSPPMSQPGVAPQELRVAEPPATTFPTRTPYPTIDLPPATALPTPTNTRVVRDTPTVTALPFTTFTPIPSPTFMPTPTFTPTSTSSPRLFLYQFQHMTKDRLYLRSQQVAVLDAVRVAQRDKCMATLAYHENILVTNRQGALVMVNNLNELRKIP